MTEAPAIRKHGKNAFLFVIVCVAMDMIGFGIIIPVMPSLLEELTGNPAEETIVIGGYLMATYGLLNFAAMPTIGNLSDRFGRRPVLLVSIATLGMDFIIMGLADSVWLLFVGRALTGISSATFSTANAYIADVTEPEERGKAFGMIGAAFGIGFMYSGAFRIAWAAAGQPKEWIGTWFSNFAGFNQVLGLALLAVSPEVSKEGVRPPRWYIAVAIIVGVASLAFVFGIQFARSDAGQAALTPSLWQLSDGGYDCAPGMVKGNMGQGGMIFHVPGSYWYSQTVAEDCFRSEWDARNRGYRAPRGPRVTFTNADAG